MGATETLLEGSPNRRRLSTFKRVVMLTRLLYRQSDGLGHPVRPCWLAPRRRIGRLRSGDRSPPSRPASRVVVVLTLADARRLSTSFR